MENNEMKNNEDINLGEKIVLSGFSKTDKSDTRIIKKMVGHYLNNFEKYGEIEKLSLTLKVIHNSEKENDIKKIEIKGQLESKLGIFNSEETDENLYSALDTALKKLEKQIAKEKDKNK